MRDRFGIFGTVTRIRKLSTFGNDVKNTQHQHSEEEATWESEDYLMENFPEFHASLQDNIP